MKAITIMFGLILTKKFMFAQALPLPLSTDIRGLLDFGVTAVVAVFMIWIYSRQVGDWQKQSLELSKFHAAEMASLVSRYENEASEIRKVIADNNVVKGKLLEGIERLLDVNPCPYARDLSQHPAAKQRN